MTWTGILSAGAAVLVGAIVLFCLLVAWSKIEVDRMMGDLEPGDDGADGR